MTKRDGTIVILGATGQQGGATATALVGRGWSVRAIVRDPGSPRARALAALGIELVAGDLGDRASLDRALRGAHGVFSVQPSSGQPEYGVTDADEERFGIAVADAAAQARVRHLVYTSVGALRGGTGVGHFESKWRIEQHVRSLDVPFTIVRPAAFMELLLQPHFGLATDRLFFFLDPDRRMQFIAVEDVGHLVADVFEEPSNHLGRTFDLAGDTLSGEDMAAKIGRAVGRAVTYARFPDEVLGANPLLRRLVDLVNAAEGVVGEADIPALRARVPGLLDFDAWLTKTGASAIRALR